MCGFLPNPNKESKMKKMILATLMTIASACVLAAGAFPIWNCKDPTVLKEAAEKAATLNEKANCLMLLGVLEKNIKTFPEFSKLVDSICDDLFKEEKVNAERKLTMKKMFCVNRGQFINEAFDFSEKNPSWYDYYVCRVYRGDRTKCYQMMFNALKNFFHYYSPEVHMSALELLNGYAKEGNVAAMKQDIAGFRKHYEQLASKNKKWQPVLDKYDQIMKAQ